jgi:hypothetical protein
MHDELANVTTTAEDLAGRDPSDRVTTVTRAPPVSSARSRAVLLAAARVLGTGT